MSIRFHIDLRNFGRQVDIHIIRGGDRPDLGDKQEFALPIKWEPVDTSVLYDEPPALSMDMRAGQELMDALWVVGLRPTEGTGSAGSLAATQSHLMDMRAIAFGKLMINLPTMGKM